MGTGGCKAGGEELLTEYIWDFFNIHFKEQFIYPRKLIIADVSH